MNSTQLIKFVELYREAECLWNINSSVYKDRDARDQCLKEISQEMCIEGFGPREAAQKIKNIRCAYQELKKIRNSKKSGVSADDIYRPKVPWFDVVDAFLKKVSKIKPTTSNLLSNEPQATPTEVQEQEAFLEFCT
jgi:hypothetical protein